MKASAKKPGKTVIIFFYLFFLLLFPFSSLSLSLSLFFSLSLSLSIYLFAFIATSILRNAGRDREFRTGSALRADQHFDSQLGRA